ncbi:exported hypothetical protein [Brevibacillus sp. IT-7CA2]|uniref:hypothetical protein n=1 Tax=Brevibacillus sp. IT-7CA2 TaxID=3026436 RepID=UPI0039E08CF6
MKRTLILFSFFLLTACSNNTIDETASAPTEKIQGTTEQTAKENEAKHTPQDDLDFAKKAFTWFEESRLPMYNMRDTTTKDKNMYNGLTASMSSNGVNVLLFDNEENAKKYESDTFSMLTKGRVLLSIKDEANADNYVRVLSEEKAIPDLAIKYLSPQVEKFVTQLNTYKSYQDFTNQFLKFDQPTRTSIYQTYLYTREFEWEGTVLDRDTVPEGLILWCGPQAKKPKHWLDSKGKIVSLSDIVVIKLKDEDTKAYIEAGNKVKFKGKMNRIWNKEWNKNWEFIDSEVIK